MKTRNALVAPILIFLILYACCIHGSSNTRKQPSLVAITKEYGLLKVVGMPMQVHYKIVNESTTETFYDITIRDESFDVGGRFAPPSSSSASPTGNVRGVEKRSDGSVLVALKIPSLNPSQRLTRTISLMPATPDALVDKAAVVTFSDDAGRVHEARSPSRGLFTVFASMHDQNLFLQGITSSVSSSRRPNNKNEDDDGEWWSKFPIFDEWRQRMLIGIWAALASALPMYWYESLRDELLAPKKAKRNSLTTYLSETRHADENKISNDLTEGSPTNRKKKAHHKRRH